MKKNVFKVLLSLFLVLSTVVTLAACRKGNEPENTEPTMEYLIKDGIGDYIIIYGASNTVGGRHAYSLNGELAKVTGHQLTFKMDTEAEIKTEILLGDTNRQLSKDLKASVEDGARSDSHLWGFAYRDGQFAFYYNSTFAFERGLEEFKALFLKDGALVVSSDTWKKAELTLADYNQWLAEEEAKLKAEEEAKKNAELDKRLEAVLKAISEAEYTNADFGATDDWKTKYSMPTNIFEPSASITEEHPRVMLTKDDIPKIRALLEDPEYEFMAKNFWELADSEGFTGIFPEKKHDDGERCRYDTTVLAQIEARALAYLVTGHKAYGYEAIHGIKNAMNTLIFTWEDELDIYHGPSHVMIMLAEVYDWCYDLLTEEDKKQLISGCVHILITGESYTDEDFVLDSNKPSLMSELSPRAKRYGLEFNFPPDNMSAVTGHGTGPQFLRDYMMVTVAFADEMPSWWDYVGGRFYQEYLPVAKEIYRNGYVSQGTSCYAPIKLLVNLWPAQLLKTSTGVNPYPDYIGDCADFMYSMLQPNLRYFETGDGQRLANGGNTSYPYFYFFGSLYNDTFAIQAAKNFSNNFQKYTKDSIYTLCPALTLALCAQCDKATGAFPADLPLYTYTPYPGGQTTARNSWSEDGAAVYMKIGELTMSNHDTFDSGSFQIYYKGVLAGASGGYKSFGSTHYYTYLKSTISTNGLLIYNPELAKTDKYYSGGQTRLDSPSTLEVWKSGLYDVAKVTGVENSSGKYSYLAGDITKAYSSNTVDYVGRRMLSVFNDSGNIPMVFFVFDSITSDSADFKKSFLIHTVNEPTVAGSATDKAFTVTPDANGRMTATIVNGEGAMVLQNVYGGDYMHKIGGDGYAFWVGNNNEFDGTEQSGANILEVGTDYDERMWGRIEITAKGETHTDMLNVMYVTDSGEMQIVPAKLIESDDGAIVGATLNNVTAVFVKDSVRYSETLTFTAEGSGSMQYYISGLFEGNWKVSVNGGAARAVKVSEDGGLLSFTADAGTVTVTPDGILPEGHARIEYHIGDGILPSDAPLFYKIGETTLLPTPTYKNGYFGGWYSDKALTQAITAIPTDATGTFKAYAKYTIYDVYYDLDFSSDSSKPNMENVGGSDAILYADKENDCIVWSVTKSSGSNCARIYSKNMPKISDVDIDDMSITYEFSISKNPGVTTMRTIMLLMISSSETGKSYGGLSVFGTTNDGGVYLADKTKDSSMLIGTLRDDGTVLTLKFVIDFDGGSGGSALLTAYDEDNNQLASTTLSVPSSAVADGVTSMVEFIKWLNTYQLFWLCYDSGDGQKSDLRIHKLYAAEGNRTVPTAPVGYGKIDYVLNGGILPKDAPLTYKQGEATPLPTLTCENGVFLGWYSDKALTKPISVIPDDAEGDFKVYAKCEVYDLYFDFDYTKDEEDLPELDNVGTSQSTLTHDKENDCLVWNITSSTSSKNSRLYDKSAPMIASLDCEDKCVTFEFTLSKTPGVAFPVSTFSLQTSTSAIKKNYGGMVIMSTTVDGKIYLSSTKINSMLIADLDENGTAVSFKIVIDFDGGDGGKALLTAYTSENVEICHTSLSVPETDDIVADNITSMADWMKWLVTYNMFWIALDDNGNSSEMRIHRLYASEGNRTVTVAPAGFGSIEYVLSGGTLPSGAPTVYECGTALSLPIPTHHSGDFAGWYLDSEYTKPITEISAASTGKVTVYAKFTLYDNVYLFDGEKETKSEKLSYTYVSGGTQKSGTFTSGMSHNNWEMDVSAYSTEEVVTEWYDTEKTKKKTSVRYEITKPVTDGKAQIFTVVTDPSDSTNKILKVSKSGALVKKIVTSYDENGNVVGEPAVTTEKSTNTYLDVTLSDSYFNVATATSGSSAISFAKTQSVHDEYAGRSFISSLDVMLDSTVDYTDSADFYLMGTIVTWVVGGAANFDSPIKVNGKTGEILYRQNVDKYATTGKYLSSERYTSVAVLFEPAKNTFSVIIDGETVATDVLMTTDDLAEIMSRESTLDNKIAVDVTGLTQEEAQRKQGESYIFTTMRFLQSAPDLYVDNISVRYLE